jgi:hypothetical protein
MAAWVAAGARGARPTLNRVKERLRLALTPTQFAGSLSALLAQALHPEDLASLVQNLRLDERGGDQKLARRRRALEPGDDVGGAGFGFAPAPPAGQHPVRCLGQQELPLAGVRPPHGGNLVEKGLHVLLRSFARELSTLRCVREGPYALGVRSISSGRTQENGCAIDLTPFGRLGRPRGNGGCGRRFYR